MSTGNRPAVTYVYTRDDEREYQLNKRTKNNLASKQSKHRKMLREIAAEKAAEKERKLVAMSMYYDMLCHNVPYFLPLQPLVSNLQFQLEK